MTIRKEVIKFKDPKITVTTFDGVVLGDEDYTEPTKSETITEIYEN